jgi:hypothetical protein
VTHVVPWAVFHSPVSNGWIDINRSAVENPGRVFTCVMYRDCIFEMMSVQQRCYYITTVGRIIRSKMLGIQPRIEVGEGAIELRWVYES